MPVVDGAKYACKSCIRGHRGRPVKQCDHCRTARKSQSHHGKCDCGSKKDKKDQGVSLETSQYLCESIIFCRISRLILETEADCCCYDGERCRCSTKHEAIEARMERSLKRPTVPVKCKPSFVKSHSDEKVLQTMSGHHRTTHRMNNAAHTSGQPYPLSRPHSHHGQDRVNNEIKHQSLTEDETEASTSDPFNHTSLTIPEADDADVQEEIISYDFDKHFASASQQSTSTAMPTAEDQTSQLGNQQLDWDWAQQSTGVESANSVLELAVDTTPSFTQDAMFPFSPADLPLISPQVSNFNQTISHSSDFTNETAWTAENYLVDVNVAVQGDWPSLETSLLEDNFQQANFGKMPSFNGATQQSFVPMTPVVPDLSESPGKTARNNSMVIPVDPDSPGEKAVEDWWPIQPSHHPTVQTSMQQPSQSRSNSMEATNYDGNYDWLY